MREIGNNPIPLIDLAPLTQTGGAVALAAQMRAALEDIGFLIIVNHGVPQELIEQTFDQARRFHDQDTDAKHAVLMNEHNNGYMAMARYGVRTSRVSEDALPDLNESFFIKRERSPDDPLSKRRFGGPNIWPSDLLGFREKTLAYTEAVDTLGRRLLPAVALALNLPDDTFDPAFEESQFSFRLSHYPPQGRTKGQYGFAPHTDANFMTFLAQSGVPGLQIMSKSGDWLDVPHVPGSFVVNSGDMLHRWTNGRFASTPHRVVPPEGQARYAVPYFLGPHMDTLIKCLPGCSDENNPARYSPVTYDDYLKWWYDANYNFTDQKDLTVN